MGLLTCLGNDDSWGAHLGDNDGQRRTETRGLKSVSVAPGSSFFLEKNSGPTDIVCDRAPVHPEQHEWVALGL